MEKLKKIIQPGDVVNIDGSFNWYEFWLAIAYWAIRRAQKKLFGEKSRWVDTHTMLYLGAKKLFSVELPKCIYDTIDSVRGKKVTVWRYTKKELGKDDIKIMQKGAKKLVGTTYDVGQLLNIAVNQILGYPYDEKVKWFDMGAKRKVCSVGVAYIYQYWRQKTGKKVQRLFSELNSLYWEKWFVRDFYIDGGRWNVENTYPANFANTEMFNNEFRCIYSGIPR